MIPIVGADHARLDHVGPRHDVPQALQVGADRRAYLRHRGAAVLAWRPTHAAQQRDRPAHHRGDRRSARSIRSPRCRSRTRSRATRSGIAMGAMNFFRSLGSALVVAVMGAIILAWLGAVPERGTGAGSLGAFAACLRASTSPTCFAGCSCARRSAWRSPSSRSPRWRSARCAPPRRRPPPPRSPPIPVRPRRRGRRHQADLAREAFARYGKGRHPARLNFGDCASYALAIVEAEPLLFRRTDFGATDVEVVTS